MGFAQQHLLGRQQDHQPPFPDQQPLLGRQQPPFPDQQPLLECQQPLFPDQQPLLGHQHQLASQLSSPGCLY